MHRGYGAPYPDASQITNAREVSCLARNLPKTLQILVLRGWPSDVRSRVPYPRKGCGFVTWMPDRSGGKSPSRADEVALPLSSCGTAVSRRGSSRLPLLCQALCLDCSVAFVSEAVGLSGQGWPFAQVQVLHSPSRQSHGTSADQAGIGLSQKTLPVKLPTPLLAGADTRGFPSAYGDRSAARTCRNQHGE